MKLFLEALNHPVDAFRKKNKYVSWILVFITILLNSVFEPVLHHFVGIGKPAIDALRMIKLTGFGTLSYLIICLVIWGVCRCFGSKTNLMDHIYAWGISYFPTAVCSIGVALTEAFFFIFWNNTIWGMILNIIFMGILLWKTVLYVIYLRELANLNGWRLVGAFVVIGIFILVMAPLNGYVGLKTPIL